LSVPWALEHFVRTFLAATDTCKKQTLIKIKPCLIINWW
jgi:hypothetical protein